MSVFLLSPIVKFNRGYKILKNTEVNHHLTLVIPVTYDTNATKTIFLNDISNCDIDFVLAIWYYEKYYNLTVFEY